jgi:hypothetical protein
MCTGETIERRFGGMRAQLNGNGGVTLPVCTRYVMACRAYMYRYPISFSLSILLSSSSTTFCYSSHLIKFTIEMQSVEAATEKIEAITGHVFTSKLLCAEAVQMAAPQTMAIYSGGLQTVENNKRLAVLGDAVLAKVLCAAWFKARDNRGKEK